MGDTLAVDVFCEVVPMLANKVAGGHVKILTCFKELPEQLVQFIGQSTDVFKQRTFIFGSSKFKSKQRTLIFGFQSSKFFRDQLGDLVKNWSHLWQSNFD